MQIKKILLLIGPKGEEKIFCFLFGYVLRRVQLLKNMIEGWLGLVVG